MPLQGAIACAVCLSQTLFAIALTTPIAASPVNTGFCQIWDEGLASVPWPGKYAVVRATVPDFLTALDVKWHAADGRLHVLIGSSSAAWGRREAFDAPSVCLVAEMRLGAANFARLSFQA